MHSRSSSFLVKNEEDTDKDKKTCMIMIRKYLYDVSCLKIELRVMMKVSEGMVEEKELRSLSVLGTSSEWTRLIEM